MITLFKYRYFTTETNRVRLHQLLSRQEIYCPTPSELDDPYDCNIGTANHLMWKFVKFGVFCACGDEHNDILLFSNYADKHTGVCLVFSVEEGGTIGESTFLGFAKRIRYKRDFPQFSQKNIHELLLTKYAVWHYQDEFRTIANLDDNPSKFRRFEKEELTGIRFGLKMKEDDQREIAQWTRDAGLSHVQFFKARLRQDCFRLAYDPIDFVDKVNKQVQATS